VSDDGETAIVIIALLGNPFSPRYAAAKERGRADALRFCSMNVAVYGRGGAVSAWTFDESHVTARDAGGVAIGRSSMRWRGDDLVIVLDERTPTFRRPVQGSVVVRPEALPNTEIAIDDEGRHLWWPVAPLAQIEVDLPSPGVRFTGHGYHDANAGDVPLEASFKTWSWSRARSTRDGRALLAYDVTCQSDAERSLAFAVARDGSLRDLAANATRPLPRTLFGLARHTRADAGHAPRVVRSLEDGPFYARALVETTLEGERIVAVHETLAAHRLRRAWVRFCIGYRMRVVDDGRERTFGG